MLLQLKATNGFSWIIRSVDSLAPLLEITSNSILTSTGKTRLPTPPPQRELLTLSIFSLDPLDSPVISSNSISSPVCIYIRTKHATEDMAKITFLFEDMCSTGLNLPEDFKAMLLLTRLPDDYFQFCSTLVQTVTEPDFTCDLITTHINTELNMCSSCSLSSRISEVQISEHFANWTIAIQQGPPANNHWHGQNQQGSQNQAGPSKPQHGPRPFHQGQGHQNPKPKMSQKDKKKRSYDQRQRQKGKQKATVNKVEGFVNSWEGTLPDATMEEEEDPCTRFINHLEVEEDNGMNVDLAGPSNQPF